MVGISETLRHELVGTGVGVSVLCPGFVRTKINRSDRNRPMHLANGSDAPGAPSILSAVAPVLAESQPVLLEPDDVAVLTLEAVQRDDFWIVTDPSILALAASRYYELNAIIASASAPTGVPL